MISPSPCGHTALLFIYLPIFSAGKSAEVIGFCAWNFPVIEMPDESLLKTTIKYKAQLVFPSVSVAYFKV